MQTGPISFCDCIGHNIKSDDFKRDVMTDLEKLVHFKVIQRHHQTYDSEMDSIIQTHPHFVSLKSNGNPYLLYFTRVNMINQCIFIDKKIQQGYCNSRMIMTHFAFSNDVFDNTLFDGEMIKTNAGSWIFLINDILSASNKHLIDVELGQRLAMIVNILNTKFCPDVYDVCAIQVKKYFRTTERDSWEALRMRLDYSTRGLTYKPLSLRDKEILMNFDTSLILRSPKSDMTAKSLKLQHNQFLLRKTHLPDVYDMFKTFTTCSILRPVGTACISSMSTSKMLARIFQACNASDLVKFNCVYSPKFLKWTPEYVSPS